MPEPEPTNWAVHAEFDLGFDLTEDMLGEIAEALDAPVSWDALTRRLGATISLWACPIDAVLARANRDISLAVAAFAAVPAGQRMPFMLVFIEAMTFEEQDRRLAMKP